MERLDDQIAWYDRKSISNQQAYKRINIIEIIEIPAAAIIPFLAFSGFGTPGIVTAGLPLNLRSIEA